MTHVMVQINIKEFGGDGPQEDQQAVLTSIAAAFVTIAMATNTKIITNPTETDRSVYITFAVPEAQVESFCTIIDWTTFGQAQIL
jgi:hypothetical protein